MLRLKSGACSKIVVRVRPGVVEIHAGDTSDRAVVPIAATIRSALLTKNPSAIYLLGI